MLAFPFLAACSPISSRCCDVNTQYFFPFFPYVLHLFSFLETSSVSRLVNPEEADATLGVSGGSF